METKMRYFIESKTLSGDWQLDEDFEDEGYKSLNHLLLAVQNGTGISYIDVMNYRIVVRELNPNVKVLE